MHPIYILEGPDGSGKTTLAKSLVEQFGAHYMHLTYRFPNRMFTYHTAALEMAIRQAKTQPVIIDRWWPSINIYDDEFRGKRSFPLAGRMLDRAGMANGVIYVACMPGDMEQFVRDFEKRKAEGGEMYETVGGVHERYVDWWSTMTDRADMITYDRFTDGIDMMEFGRRLRAKFVEVNARINPEVWQNRQFGGNFHQGARKYFIVGERSNPKGRHEVWPFFDNGYSSFWVTNVLEQAGISEYDLQWANAIDTSGWGQPALLKKVINRYGPHTVLALGGKAEKVLWSAGIKCDKLPHPAYVKRFQYGGPSEYLNYFKG